MEMIYYHNPVSKSYNKPVDHYRCFLTYLNVENGNDILP